MIGTPKLVWLDLETTGLVPDEGEILEIGAIITELDLTEKARKGWILPHRRENILTKMNDYVLKMHLSSGLLAATHDLFGKGQVSRAQIYSDVEAWIRQKCDWMPEKECYLSGSSIGFDKGWLQHHAPAILDTVSYRVGDVSAFKVFFPGLLDQFIVHTEPKLALDDLDYSIDQLRQMRELLSLGVKA